MEKTLLSCMNGEHVLSDEDRFDIASLLTKRCSLRTKRCMLSVLTYGLFAVRQCGILSRVHFDEKANRWSYCTGQSYPDEIREIRKILLNN